MARFMIFGDVADRNDGAAFLAEFADQGPSPRVASGTRSGTLGPVMR